MPWIRHEKTSCPKTQEASPKKSKCLRDIKETFNLRCCFEHHWSTMTTVSRTCGKSVDQGLKQLTWFYFQGIKVIYCTTETMGQHPLVITKLCITWDGYNSLNIWDIWYMYCIPCQLAKQIVHHNQILVDVSHTFMFHLSGNFQFHHGLRVDQDVK